MKLKRGMLALSLSSGSKRQRPYGRGAAAWLGLSALLLLTACGGDDKPGEKDAGTGGDNTTGNGGNGDDAGGTDNGGSTGEREEVTDAPNCDDDDATTPGSECKGIVSCGGNAEKPHACPVATHSCCTAGFPSEDTVNCFTGKNACEDGESIAPCDGPEDCGSGQVCCVTLTPSPATQCVPAGSCGGGITMCHADEDCEVGSSCSSGANSFWGFCM